MSTPPAQSTLKSTPPDSGSAPATPLPPAPKPAEEGLTGQQRAIVIGVIVLVLLIVVGLITAAVYLVNNPAQAATVRDVFIIFMALEAMLIGAALVILIVQVAVLTNLLKNEIKPILEATQETVNTVRGTTLFVSENLAEPIMKLNSYVAGLSKVVEALGKLGGLFGRL